MRLSKLCDAVSGHNTSCISIRRRLVSRTNNSSGYYECFNLWADTGRARINAIYDSPGFLFKYRQKAWSVWDSEYFEMGYLRNNKTRL